MSISKECVFLQLIEKEIKKKKESKLKCVSFSYLAETPQACEEKVSRLLGYMLSVEGEDEPRYGNFDSMVDKLIYFLPF